MDSALKAFQAHLKEVPLRPTPFPYDLADEEVVCGDLDDLTMEQLVSLEREASEYLLTLPRKLLDKYETLYVQNANKEHMFLDIYQQIQKNVLAWTFLLEYAQMAQAALKEPLGFPESYSFDTDATCGSK
jgi:hypothetical protein